MAGDGKYLRPMLDAGSSRVFNCNDVARKLEEEKADSPHIFRTPQMNRVVVIKEVLRSDDPAHPRHLAVGTKLYLPYDPSNIYDGGRSIFLHSTSLMRVIHEHFGARHETDTSKSLEHDLKVLQVLDTLPSLDGFLMRDALELEGLSAEERYFEISSAERTAIQDFIRGKMELLVRAAYGGRTPSYNQVNSLTDKVWEAKDLEALNPLIQAFRFPVDKALSIFAGWKGIMFYAFEYHNSRVAREQFAGWLKTSASPREMLPRETREWMDTSRRTIVERLRAHWVGTNALLDRFDRVYADFVASANPVGFIEFILEASDIYWRLGDSLSKINHAINCWNLSSKTFPERRLPFDRLEKLLDMLKTILAPLTVARPGSTEPLQAPALVAAHETGARPGGDAAAWATPR